MAENRLKTDDKSCIIFGSSVTNSIISKIGFSLIEVISLQSLKKRQKLEDTK